MFKLILSLISITLLCVAAEAASVNKSSYILVNDYAGVSKSRARPGEDWYYNRIGSVRGAMGQGEERSYTVKIGGGLAQVKIEKGYAWAGVWERLTYQSQPDQVLRRDQLLGPFVKARYQAKISGVRIDIIDGVGKFKVELKDGLGKTFIYPIVLKGGPRRIDIPLVRFRHFDFSQNAYTSAQLSPSIKELNWVIEGKGAFVSVDRIGFHALVPPLKRLQDAAFLYSYGHLSQAYDPRLGLVSDRARWPAEDLAGIPASGAFAMASVLGAQLGFVDAVAARRIVAQISQRVMRLPTQKGLLPHFYSKKSSAGASEFSSVDTVVALLSLIVARQTLGLDTTAFEKKLFDIDWTYLTDNHRLSIAHGVDTAGKLLTHQRNDVLRWDTFGSEAFLVAVAYASATGKRAKLRFLDEKTWDGSGFNDEMAALFFPMLGTDAWNHDWTRFRRQAAQSQLTYFKQRPYAQPVFLIGISASEVPTPWAIKAEDGYGAWGIGGHNGLAHDGRELLGYPIIAPHYVAMIAAEHDLAFRRLFSFLIKKGLFTPLNNVESLGVDKHGKLHVNALKGSWNLSLQTLGLARSLFSPKDCSSYEYIPYQALRENAFLLRGFRQIFNSSYGCFRKNK